MDRTEFLNRLVLMFPSCFPNDEKMQASTNARLGGYRQVLSDSTIDFNKLYELILTEWEYKEVPRTSWISGKAKKCTPAKRHEKETWRDHYIITKWSRTSIWVKFFSGGLQHNEYKCGKEGLFERTCVECLKCGKGIQGSKNLCFDCCHECVGKCNSVLPCAMRELVLKHNEKELALAAERGEK